MAYYDASSCDVLTLQGENFIVGCFSLLEFISRNMLQSLR